MGEPSDIQEFPDIGNKLAAPTKKSLFERQKAEAEAKRLREEAETAAVYADFVKSFDDEQLPSRPTGPRLGEKDALGPPSRTSLGAGGPPRRHFAGSAPDAAGRGGSSGPRPGPTSGPGSLGPPPGSLARKRAHDGQYAATREKGQGMFAFDDAPILPTDAKAAFQEADGEEEQEEGDRTGERAMPKPAMLLSSLPPGTSPAVVKSYLPPTLHVDEVRILPPTGPGSNERRSTSAIATLAKDTPASDIDAAVSALQNTYLGCGYYLSIVRHLSSAALNAGLPGASGGNSLLASMPFGARPVPTGPGSSLSRAPPPSSIHRGGYAPPSSYSSAAFGRGGPVSAQVAVTPPTDLKQLKLIHKTVEALLTHGPEFEALLMSRAQVQRDERWAWLWDPRSAGGVWYRWRLWQLLTRSQSIRRGRGFGPGVSHRVFEGSAPWVAPSQDLRFEYTTHLDEFISDSDYDSSEEESGDEDAGARQRRGGMGPPEVGTIGTEPERAYLNPLQKAKLTHLLARLPTSNAKLRKGDVARITAFAIKHAGEGADEVVDSIVSNIHQPFAFTGANPNRRRDQLRAAVKIHDEEATDDRDSSKEHEDMSAAQLVALYIVSDILSSSSTSGVRHAWRYRQLFETALKSRMVFEGLGQLERRLHWGRLRAEKWKRSVGSVLTLWEGWCVFPQAAQEHFVSVFTNPPPPPSDKDAADAEHPGKAIPAVTKSKWKAVDDSALAREPRQPVDEIVAPAPLSAAGDDDLDIDGEAMADDLDGEDLDGEPMDEDDLDGEPMDDDVDMADAGPEDMTGAHGGRTSIDVIGADHPPVPAGYDHAETNAAHLPDAVAPKRSRPRAEDMFADSDEES